MQRCCFFVSVFFVFVSFSIKHDPPKLSVSREAGAVKKRLLGARLGLRLKGRVRRQLVLVAPEVGPEFVDSRKNVIYLLCVEFNSVSPLVVVSVPAQSKLTLERLNSLLVAFEL